MPRLLPRQTPKGTQPEPELVDGLLFNGRDVLAEKRAAHRARLAAERQPATARTSSQQTANTEE